MRIFYVLYVRNGILKDCLEAIRFLCNPLEKYAAHITVRGPYQKQMKKDELQEINDKLFGNHIIIDRGDNFFNLGQNTVFFRCTSSKLKEVWKKRDYPYNPHITIYDGHSVEFSRKLYSVVSKYSYNIDLQADELIPLFSDKGQESFYLGLIFNNELISKIAEEDLKSLNVMEMSEEHRLSIIKRICKHLSVLSLANSLVAL